LVSLAAPASDAHCTMPNLEKSFVRRVMLPAPA
jgi:hypothetical protein